MLTSKQTSKQTKHLEPCMIHVKSSILRIWFGEVAHTRRYGKDLFLVENYYLESKIIRSILHDHETKTRSSWCCFLNRICMDDNTKGNMVMKSKWWSLSMPWAVSTWVTLTLICCSAFSHLGLTSFLPLLWIIFFS